MFFTLFKILGSIADPATLLAFFTLAVGTAELACGLRLAALLQSISVGTVLLFDVPPGENWLALHIASHFPANPALPCDVASFIAVGGMEPLEQSAAWGQPTLNDPAPIVALINLRHRYPEARLVFTGGPLATSVSGLSEAEIVRQFINELGADATTIACDGRARNTHENALLADELVHPKPAERWILVLQAIGMPRGVGVFRCARRDAIPIATGFLSGSRQRTALSFNLLGGLNLASMAADE